MLRYDDVHFQAAFYQLYWYWYATVFVFTVYDCCQNCMYAYIYIPDSIGDWLFGFTSFVLIKSLVNLDGNFAEGKFGKLW